MALCAKRLLPILPLLLFVSAAVHAQTTPKAPAQKTAAQPAKYPDSADGLKLLLQDVLASAKLGGNPKLAAFVDDMQIPDYQNWFPKVLGKGTGDAWSKNYESTLDFMSVHLQALFIRLAQQNPEIVAQKITGTPLSDSERRTLQLFQQPVDVFFVALKTRAGGSGQPAGAPDASITSLGYFWFIDGKFRWDPTNLIGEFSMAVPGSDASSDANSSPAADSPAAARSSLSTPPGVLQAGQNGVGYPSCRDCPGPVYTAPVRAARFEGTVKLQAVIQPDGSASNIQIMQGASSEVDANAVDTVKHWRFNPAIGPNGKPVAVIVPLEVSYQQAQPAQSAASAPPPRQSQAQSQAQSTLPCSSGRPILKRGTQPALPPCPDPPPDESPSAGYPPARSPSPSESLIERARDAAFEFSEKLPNYICEEFMSRYMQRGRDETPQDVVSAEIVYDDSHESYRNVKINDRPTDRALEEVGGSWSTGEFASTLLALFNPDTDAHFQSGGASTIGGFSADVYDFEVRREKSHWELHVDSQTLAPAYGGSVWVDPKTARVLRIEMDARNIPTDFPMDQVESAVDYSYVTIGGTSFLLPVHAESLGCQRGTNQCSHNVIDFRNYHEFKVDIKLGN